MPHEEHRLPSWTPRLARRDIDRLYRSCGTGILDGDLIDEVGFALYVRCESILKVKEAMRGNIACPTCGSMMQRICHPSKDELLHCPHCNWECAWQEYRNTFEGKLLNAGDMERFCKEFLGSFAVARSHGEKLVLIDTLIHRVHGELVGGNKPGAYAFIDGDIEDVAAFLDRLTYGDRMPEEVKAKRDAWRKSVRTASKFWAKQLLEDGRTEENKKA